MRSSPLAISLLSLPRQGVSFLSSSVSSNHGDSTERDLQFGCTVTTVYPPALTWDNCEVRNDFGGLLLCSDYCGADSHVALTCSTNNFASVPQVTCGYLGDKACPGDCTLGSVCDTCPEPLPDISTDQVCDAFQKWWYADWSTQDDFGTRCTCTGNVQAGFHVQCQDKCQRCHEGFCGDYTVNSARIEYNAYGLDLEENDLWLNFVKECINDGNTMLCIEDDLSKDDSDEWTAYVDNQACTSMDFTDCDDTGDNSEFLISCSNQGFGDNMNFCDPSSVLGLFRFFLPTESNQVSLGMCQEGFSAKETNGSPVTETNGSSAATILTVSSGIMVRITLALVAMLLFW